MERIFTRRNSFLALYAQIVLFACMVGSQRLGFHGMLGDEFAKPIFNFAMIGILALCPFTIWSLMMSLGCRLYLESAMFGPRVFQLIDTNTPFSWILWPEVKQSFRDRWGSTTEARKLD